MTVIGRTPSMLGVIAGILLIVIVLQVVYEVFTGYTLNNGLPGKVCQQETFPLSRYGKTVFTVMDEACPGFDLVGARIKSQTSKEAVVEVCCIKNP